MQAKYVTSKLLIDFTQCPKSKRLVDFFPVLHNYPEFLQQQDDNYIRIAILTADADSPFMAMRGDREVMIKSIFEFLEIGTNNPRAKEFYRKVIAYEHTSVSECWCAYLQMQYNVDFTDWAFTKQTYDMLISEGNRQKSDKEDAIVYANWRIKLRNEIRKLGDDLKTIEPKIFKDSKMARPVAIEMKKIKGYPEKYARSINV